MRLRLYAGRFTGPVRGTHEVRIRDLPGFEAFGPEEIASKLLVVAASKQHRDKTAVRPSALLPPRRADHLAERPARTIAVSAPALRRAADCKQRRRDRPRLHYDRGRTWGSTRVLAT